MPPSGYTTEQARLIGNFLKLCSSELINEGKNKSLTPNETLKAECKNIRTILNSNGSGQFSRDILHLTQIFYEKILENNPQSFKDLEDISSNLLRKLESEILDIHVPEI